MLSVSGIVILDINPVYSLEWGLIMIQRESLLLPRAMSVLSTYMNSASCESRFWTCAVSLMAHVSWTRVSTAAAIFTESICASGFADLPNCSQMKEGRRALSWRTAGRDNKKDSGRFQHGARHTNKMAAREATSHSSETLVKVCSPGLDGAAGG